jgi:uracil-DNA glycosylase
MVDTMTFIDVDADESITWLDHPQSINGSLWLTGVGNLPCDVMIVGEHPGRDETRFREMWKCMQGRLLDESARKAGLDMHTVYKTHLLKYQPKSKSIKAPDIKISMPLLNEEITRANPRLIITFGAHSLKAVMGRGFKLSEYRGTALQHPERPDTTVFPMYSPSYIMRSPHVTAEWDADWRMFAYVYRGESAEHDAPDWTTCHSVQELQEFKQFLFANYPKPLLVLDCEWEGENYMAAGAYIRTAQIGYELGKVLIVEFFDEHGQCMCTRPGPDGNMIPYMELDIATRLDIMAAMLEVLGTILEAPDVRLVGHHLRADGHELGWYGIDVKANTYWDTMVCEHTIDSRGPFGLTELTVQHTNMGRYDTELVAWKEAHPKECINGYGAIPAEILLPYAACDVDAPRRIMAKQQSAIEPFTIPRGKYPSLWDASLGASVALYEPERVGLLIDRERLDMVTRMYATATEEVENKVIQMADVLGVPEFNPRSVDQVRNMLFDTLEMTPIKTTKGAGNKPWSWVLDQGEDLQATVAASTDKDTLAILADEPGAHKLIGLLRDYRKVSYVCNSWLVDPDTAANFNTASKGGGLLSKIWPDGRLHARFSQLKETGRFGSSKPNVQNWMKRAEGELKRIVGTKGLETVFGAGATFPTLRSVITATPGYILMEADWKQAEMFVLAVLSGDSTMYDALTTPGKDLHSTTAITAFGIKTLDSNGNEVGADYLLRLAQQDVDTYGTCEGHEFEKFQKQLIYLDQRDRRLTHKAFKDGIRVSAKNLNFGIPYGRGAQSIAIQVKAETGTDEPIPTLQADIEQMMDTWKSDTYPDAWAYMKECANAVVDPGYLINPWGRYRHFAPTRDHGLIRKYGREAQNFPVQSTVADTCLITLWLMTRYREDHNLHFRFVNQIHDAILLEVPEDEIDATRTMFYETMGNVEIPMPTKPLTLGLDIDLMRRWGVKE